MYVCGMLIDGAISMQLFSQWCRDTNCTEHRAIGNFCARQIAAIGHAETSIRFCFQQRLQQLVTDHFIQTVYTPCCHERL
jgi:hypothetical protein